VKRFALTLLLVISAAAGAQTSSDERPDAVAEAPEQLVPCVPAGESAPLDGEQSGEDTAPGAPGDEQAEEETAAEPCAEPAPETFPEEEPYLGEVPAGSDAGVTGIEDDIGDDLADEIEDEFGMAIDENTLPTEASPEEEFKPGDEISEDYPVPLPSDI